MANRLGCKPFPFNNYNELVNQIESIKSNSFDIVYSNEYISYLHFFDIAALVYYAKIIKWEFQDFSINNSIMELQKLQKEIERNNFVKTNEHRYIILSRNLSKS